jgi:hypothetical protein
MEQVLYEISNSVGWVVHAETERLVESTWILVMSYCENVWEWRVLFMINDESLGPCMWLLEWIKYKLHLFLSFTVLIMCPMNVCVNVICCWYLSILQWNVWMLAWVDSLCNLPLINDTRTNGVCDSHHISSDTFFSTWLRIDMSMPWGFLWWTLD